MTTSDLPNKTDSRVAALADVRDSKIFYNERSGAYFENADTGGMVALAGARRRTFAELRQFGAIGPNDMEGLEPGFKLMRPTSAGLSLILDWEV